MQNNWKILYLFHTEIKNSISDSKTKRLSEYSLRNCLSGTVSRDLLILMELWTYFRYFSSSDTFSILTLSLMFSHGKMQRYHGCRFNNMNYWIYPFFDPIAAICLKWQSNNGKFRLKLLSPRFRSFHKYFTLL